MITIQIPDNCLTCDKSFWFNEAIVIKVPEWATFCLECCEKYPDSNIYTDWNWWFACEYEKWLKLTNELYEVM